LLAVQAERSVATCAACVEEAVGGGFVVFVACNFGYFVVVLVEENAAALVEVFHCF